MPNISKLAELPKSSLYLHMLNISQRLWKHVMSTEDGRIQQRLIFSGVKDWSLTWPHLRMKNAESSFNSCYVQSEHKIKG